MPNSTRLADLPRPIALLVLGVAALAVVLLLWAATGAPPAVVGGAGVGPAPEGDLVSYTRILERMRGGEGYYEAAHAVLVADGYGTRSVFNWRTPAWPMLLAALPPGGGQALLGVLALATVLLVYRMVRREGGIAIAVGALVAVAVSLGGILSPSSTVFSEVAAGTVLLLSVAAYGNGWRWAGLAAGLAALFLRELAAPYVVICVVLALRERRWSEVGAWVAGGLAYAAYFGWHWWMVSAQLGPMDRAYAEGWLQFGGLKFVLATVRFNGLWALAPGWLPAVLLPIGLLGLWAWRGGTLALAAVVAYLLLFMAVGKPFNSYWGAVYTPVLMLGPAWGIAAMASTLMRRETKQP